LSRVKRVPMTTESPVMVLAKPARLLRLATYPTCDYFLVETRVARTAKHLQIGQFVIGWIFVAVVNIEAFRGRSALFTTYAAYQFSCPRVPAIWENLGFLPHLETIPCGL